MEAWFYLKDVKAQMMLNEENTKLLGANSFAIFYNWIGYTGFTPIIGTILPCSLQKGKQYVFKGMITATLNQKLILKPGVCAGEKFYVPLRSFSKEMHPDSIVVLKRIANTPFYEFEYSFISNGNEKYLTFGTFITEDTVGAKKKLYGTQTVSLILDNFRLNLEDPLETSCAAFLYNKESIYEYNFRHKEMDYSLYGKGELPIELNESEKNNLTQVTKPPPPPIKPDTLKLGDVLFDFNKANLKPGALKMLDVFFKGNKDKRIIDSIYIEGHTDSIGSDEKNIQLSFQRCESVNQWLTGNKIINANAMQIHPYGRSRPIATNKTPQGRALNRRVEIIVFRNRD